MMYLAGLLLLAISYPLVELVRWWTQKHQIIDVPNARTSHEGRVPRGGGLVITCLTLVALAASVAISQVPFDVAITYSIAALVIAAISWVDDLFSVRSVIRLGFHTGAGLVILYGIGPWRIPVLAETTGWSIAAALTLFWLVGMTNAYNFMDGIDGIAAGTAVIVGVLWLCLDRLQALPFAGAIGTFTAAASLGFLLHNWAPARIFMGDVGSAFLGFTFAVLAVVGARTDPWIGLAGFLVLWPFVFDTTFTLARRLALGENVFSAHRSHLYQRLVRAGWSHRTTSVFYWIQALVCGLVARTLASNGAVLLPLVIVTMVASALTCWLLVARAEQRARARAGVVFS